MPAMEKDEEINARRCFEQELRLFYNARCKKPEWTRQRIIEVINYIEEYEAAPRLNVKRNPNHHFYANHYDVMQVGGEKYLALKRKSTADPIIKILPSEEYYNVLSEIHKNTGHGGRDKMLHTLKSQYFIPTPVVISFVKQCVTCQNKKVFPKKGIVVRPIISNSFNNRGQVDLIDLQSTPDREYKWILHYQDHTTKFSFLRPLTSKRAAEVALELLKFFLDIGCPEILQSDNGREFTASIIKELVEMWPNCKIINGRPRHPASQGPVERANQDVENMLQAWLQDNNCTNWSIGIRFVQYQKNCSFHRTIKRTPYKALFGVDPQIGLLSQVPADLLSKLRTEDDLEKILNQQQSCSSATPALNDELPVDYVNLQQPSCSSASQPSSSSRATEPIETCDRDLPVESVNLQQPSSSSTAPTVIFINLQQLSSSSTAPEPIEICDRDLPVESVNLQQLSSSSIAPEPIEICDPDLPVEPVNLHQPSSSSAAPAPIETCDSELPVASVNLQQSGSGSPTEQILLTCAVCGKECTGAHSCYSCAQNVHVICGITSCDEGYGSQLLCYLCNSEKNIQDQRDKAAENLRKAAQAMKTHSSQKFPDIDVGSSVLIEIPKIDRGPLDQKNVLGKVLEKRNESHKIGTSVGILKDWLPRNAIQLSNIALNYPIPNENLSLREICQKLSHFGGQGYLKCSCKKSNIQCSTKRCACKKHSVLCNSRCHDSSTCLNKN